MRRIVDIQEVIDGLQRVIDCGVENKFGQHSVSAEVILDKINKLEVIDTFGEPEWIPFYEIEPKEKSETYLVCTDAGYHCECRWTKSGVPGVTNRVWNWNKFDLPQHQTVVAWRPLTRYIER